MGEVVSLEDYTAKHSPGYIRGVILDSKVDRTPEKPSTRYGWRKEESDQKVAEDRRHARSEEHTSEATLTFKVTEGPRYGLVLSTIVGEAAIDEAKVRSAAQAEADSTYTPEALDAILASVERLYRREGFNAVRVQARQSVNRREGHVDVSLEIVEGPRQVLAGIDVTGAGRTNPGVVERAIDLEVGTPANLEAWSRAQRRLYDAGVFRLADIEAEPAGPPAPAADGRGLEQPVRAKVLLGSINPVSLRRSLAWWRRSTCSPVNMYPQVRS